MTDWNEIKVEYITQKKSYRQLADEHGISFSIISKRAAKEKWTEERKEWRKKTETLTLDKTAAKVSTVRSKKLKKLATAVERLSTVIEKMFNDSEQFNRYIWNSANKKPEEFVFEKADTKAILDTTKALKDLIDMTCELYGIRRVRDEDVIELQREKLELDKMKLNSGAVDEAEMGVVLLPTVSEDREADDESGSGVER